MYDEKTERDQSSSYSLTQRLMGTPSKRKSKRRFLCKILGHKYMGWHIDVKDSLIKSMTWYCERCPHEKVSEIKGDTKRLDIAAGLAMGMLG